jgi:glutathione S-transferase
MSLSASSFKLYHFPGSRSARVRWALLETVGEGFELETMQLLKGAQYSPEFLARNPNHVVPVLEIRWPDADTQFMFESTAIVEWLADAFPYSGLAPSPAGDPSRADYLQMMHFGGSWVDAMLWTLRVHGDLLPDTEADTRSIDRARQKITTEVEPQLVARLAERDFICGGGFSAADIIIGHDVIWARMYGLCQDDALTRYVARLNERPAYRQAFADTPASYHEA